MNRIPLARNEWRSLPQTGDAAAMPLGLVHPNYSRFHRALTDRIKASLVREGTNLHIVTYIAPLAGQDNQRGKR